MTTSTTGRPLARAPWAVSACPAEGQGRALAKLCARLIRWVSQPSKSAVNVNVKAAAAEVQNRDFLAIGTHTLSIYRAKSTYASGQVRARGSNTCSERAQRSM